MINKSGLMMRRRNETQENILSKQKQGKGSIYSQLLLHYNCVAAKPGGRTLDDAFVPGGPLSPLPTGSLNCQLPIAKHTHVIHLKETLLQSTVTFTLSVS